MINYSEASLICILPLLAWAIPAKCVISYRYDCQKYFRSTFCTVFYLFYRNFSALVECAWIFHNLKCNSIPLRLLILELYLEQILFATNCQFLWKRRIHHHSPATKIGNNSLSYSKDKGNWKCPCQLNHHPPTTSPTIPRCATKTLLKSTGAEHWLRRVKCGKLIVRIVCISAA